MDQDFERPASAGLFNLRVVEPLGSGTPELPYFVDQAEDVIPRAAGLLRQYPQSSGVRVLEEERVIFVVDREGHIFTDEAHCASN